MRSAATAGHHEVLVSAALVEQERALGLRALPPARFRDPIPIGRRAQVLRPARPAPTRRGLAWFTAALALTSVAIAGWNAYWLAGPLHRAIVSLLS